MPRGEVVDRILTLLRLLKNARSEGVTVAQAAQALNLGKLTATRYLQALEEHHLARCDAEGAEVSVPQPGEIRAVSGGYGLMRVRKYEVEQDACEMESHGQLPYKAGTWFSRSRLSQPVGSDVVRREQAEAGARGVACNSPGCWCLASMVENEEKTRGT